MIQALVPFDIIFDDNLKDLRKYRVLVLADQECLDDEKLGLIRKFVENGGSLVATEHSTLTRSGASGAGILVSRTS
ncbi:MAG: hypothetical protein DMG24_07815 [Acidobacteria bacterium]|nr:MAG: hypothetical protein DMG24_07815 [Acidobacteriota bacterium]